MMNLYEKLNRLDDSLVELKRVVKKKKLTENLHANEYKVVYHDNTAGRDRRPETVDDVYDDWTTSVFRADSNLDAWKEAFERVTGNSYDDYLDKDATEEDFVNYFEDSDWGDGSPILIKLSSSDSDLYDTGYTLESWIDEFVEQDYDDDIDEMLTEGNNVSSQLPTSLDSFLQDIAQMYGTITYKDIMEHEYTEEDLKQLKNYRRRFIAEIPYEGDEEADKILKKIANRVAQIVKSENMLESRNDPYFAPYGYKDAAKVLNGKAPKYYYHLKEIEMDRGDGVKLARYAMRKGLPVMVDKNSDPDYPQFSIKGEYHWDDYFYPYPTAHEEDLVVWDGKMFVEDQLTESIDPTEAKRMRETSDADVVFYGYQHKTDKPVEVGPEELSYPEFEIKKNQIIHSFDKLSQNSSKANRYGKEHDIVFYALYNRKGK